MARKPAPPPRKQSEPKSFDKVIYWLQNYAQGEFDDRRNVENLVICETDETIRPFITQLHTIAKGEYDEDNLDALVGKKRKAKHGSYEDWAKLMILWINESKKRG